MTKDNKKHVCIMRYPSNSKISYSPRVYVSYTYLTRILYVSYTYFKRILYVSLPRIKQVPRKLITLPLRNVNLCVNLCKQSRILATLFSSKISTISHSRYPFYLPFDVFILRCVLVRTTSNNKLVYILACDI